MWFRFWFSSWGFRFWLFFFYGSRGSSFRFRFDATALDYLQNLIWLHTIVLAAVIIPFVTETAYIVTLRPRLLSHCQHYQIIFVILMDWNRCIVRQSRINGDKKKCSHFRMCDGCREMKFQKNIYMEVHNFNAIQFG